MVYENVKRLCEERGTNIFNLEKACEISNGTIGKWAKRNSSPRVETIRRIANHLGVSVDELLK